MLQFTKGMKKLAGKKRQVVFRRVGELTELAAGFGMGQGKAAQQKQERKLAKGEQSSELDSDAATSCCPSTGAALSPLWDISACCQGPWRNSLLPLCFILFSWPHNLLAQPSGAHPHCGSHVPGHGHQVLLPAEPPSRPRAPPRPAVGQDWVSRSQAGAGRRHRVPQGPAHPPRLLLSPGVWKLRATSWLPQIHMGRGS